MENLHQQIFFEFPNREVKSIFLIGKEEYEYFTSIWYR